MKELKEGVKYDQEKIDWTLLPFDTLKQVVEVLELGAKKYAPDNWKKVLPPERYIKAAFRHLIDYQYTSKIDDESGKSHLAHAVCCLLFKMWHDDNEDSMNLDDLIIQSTKRGKVEFVDADALFDESSTLLS